LPSRLNESNKLAKLSHRPGLWSYGRSKREFLSKNEDTGKIKLLTSLQNVFMQIRSETLKILRTKDLTVICLWK